MTLPVVAGDKGPPHLIEPSAASRSLVSWRSPLRRSKHRPVLRDGSLPPTLFGLVGQLSAADQIWIAILTVAVVALDTVPIEVQRRIVNAITYGHEFTPIDS
ncbi:hypothetical protein SAMN05519103_05909 [Rhizobiales bacterium GAS113]|nr:hypothetical protein SAMN05519103_05909 [Rhizobiales bacterium GAS113]